MFDITVPETAIFARLYGLYLLAGGVGLLLAGGRIVRRRFESIEDVERLDERAVMNCTGLGSRALFGDEAMIPVQGQLTMLLPQPEINYGYVTGTDQGTLYMFPRQSGIVLGGTHKRGEFSTEADWSERDRMLAGHAALANRIGA